MNGITYSLGLNNSGLVSGLAGGLSAVKGFVGGMAGIAASAGALIGVGSAAAAMGLAIKKAADTESAVASLEVLAGSAQNAAQMVKGMQNLDKKSPLDFESISRAANTLLSFNVAGKDVIPVLGQLSDVSGGNAERFSHLALAYAQVASAGHLMGQDLLQLISGGFNPLQEISLRTGKSMAALKQEVEAGTISFDMVKDAFASATSEGGRFFGMTERLSKTFNGQMAMMQAAVSAALRAFGTPLINSLSPMLSQATGFANRLAPMAAEAGKALSGAVDTMRELFQSGELGDAFGLSLRVGAGTAVNLLAGSLEGITQSFGVAFGVACKLGVDELSYMTTPDFWKGLGDALTAAVQSAAAVLSEALAKFTAGLASVTGFQGLAGATALFHDASLDNEAKAKDNTAAAANHLSDYTTNQMQTLTEGLNAAWAGIKDSVGGMKIIDVAGLQNQLTGIVQNAWARGFDAKNLEVLKNWGAEVKAPNAAGVGAAVSSSPAALSDRLSKMGGYIGGNGGPRGQKAQEETSKNTKMTVTHLEKLSKFAENWNQRGGHGATF